MRSTRRRRAPECECSIIQQHPPSKSSSARTRICKALFSSALRYLQFGAYEEYTRTLLTLSLPIRRQLRSSKRGADQSAGYNGY